MHNTLLPTCLKFKLSLSAKVKYPNAFKCYKLGILTHLETYEGVGITDLLEL